MPTDKEKKLSLGYWTPGTQSLHDSAIDKYFMGFPYQTPRVYEDGETFGVEDITDWVENGAVGLYDKTNATSGYSYYKSPDGRIIRVNDYENINRDGLIPMGYSELRRMLPKREYIGGDNYRFRAMQRIPGFIDYISERAKAYGVDPNLVLHRIGKEGWIDQIVQQYNGLDASQQNDSFWSGLWDLPVGGFGSFGLDDAGSNLMSGRYELLDPNATWEEWDSTNEHGRPVKSIRTDNLKSAIEINAAEMAYRQKEVGRLYGKKGKDLNIWTNAAYHRGLHNEKLKDSDYVNRNYTYPDYIGQIATEKKLGGIVERFGANKIQQYFASGGKIHIKPSHRGRLTELKKRTGKTEAELYNDGNPAHKKMVVFARNSRKWKHSEGGPLHSYSEIAPLLVTPDKDYSIFLNSLPDNQKYTTEEDYATRRYWELNGKPKDFEAAKALGMYTWDSSDNSYHANSIAWGEDGVGYFMKPKHHDTLKYELDWYNNGLITEEGGKQREMTPEEKKEWQEFVNNYELNTSGDFYRYVPKRKDGGLLRRFDEGGDKDGDGVQLYYNPSPDDIGVNFTVSPTVEPLHVETPYTPDDFFERWYPNRMQQVQNNMATVNRSNSKLFPNKKAGRDARPFVNSMLRNAKLVKEYTLLHPGYSTQERFFKFPNALKDSVARNVLNNSVRTTNRILKKEILEDYPDDDLRWEGFGTHGFSKTTYPHLIFYTDAEPSENTIVHERTHPLRPELGSKLGKNYMTYPWLSGDAWNPMEYKIATMLNQLMTTEKGRNLEPKKANYYFSPEEINARMNAIREQQNLNPRHKITKEDLQEIKKKASRADRDGFLDLIDDDSLLRLFNEVADASTSQEKRLHDKMGGVNSAASGGLIERYGREAVLAALKKRSK